MKCKFVNLFLVLVLLPGAPSGLLAGDYCWTGDLGTSWVVQGNWSAEDPCQPPNCYPNSTNDRAFFVGGCGLCIVDLIVESIGDLGITDDVTFDGNSSVTTLTVQRLFVSTGDSPIVVTFTGAGKIQN